MKLTDLPHGMIDWSLLPPTVQAGATGSAAARARSHVADHWCRKGHILFVIAGALVIEHQDGSRYDLAGGTTWHVADDAAAAHRVVCERGATVFIVD